MNLCPKLHMPPHLFELSMTYLELSEEEEEDKFASTKPVGFAESEGNFNGGAFLEPVYPL